MIRGQHKGVVAVSGVMSRSSLTRRATQATAKSATSRKSLAREQLDEEGLSQSLLNTHRRARQEMDARRVFVELVELLEDHGPLWYTDEHRKRVQAVLKILTVN